MEFLVVVDVVVVVKGEVVFGVVEVVEGLLVVEVVVVDVVVVGIPSLQ